MWKKLLVNVFKVLLLFLIPFLFELRGMNGGGPMGVRYEYAPNFNPKFLGLPLLVWLFWGIFIFIGFVTTNAIFQKIFKPGIGFFSESYFFLYPLFDAMFVTSFDVFIDPFSVKLGLWKWLNFNDGYFGVPVGNFIGWFVIVFTTSLFVRLIDIRTDRIISNLVIPKIPLYSAVVVLLFLKTMVTVDIDCALMGLLYSLPLIVLDIYSKYLMFSSLNI
jgi:putative membrane protein